MSRVSDATTTAELVQAAIDATDPEMRSARGFARRIDVNERTVRSWLSGRRLHIRDATLRRKIERLAKSR